MKHLTTHLNEDIYSDSILDFYFKNMSIGVLDIETTGLNPSRNKFVLGGLLDIQKKTMHQVFAENRGEEAAALERFVALAADFDMVVTYNGRHFDMPFISKRSKVFGIKDIEPYNLDLYLMVNGHSPIKKFLPNLKQKTVESYMGLWQSRTDEISGAESVELYNSYEKSADPQLEKKILLHNSDDVLQLARLMKVVGKCDFHKAMFHLGFPVDSLTVKKINIERDFMTVSGIQRTSHTEYRGFSLGDYPVEASFSRRSSDFYIKIPVIRDSGLVIADLEAAGLNPEEFHIYPSCSSGFLVLEDHNKKNFMEINHFIKSFIQAFTASL